VTALLAGGFALLGVRWTQRHAAEQRRLDRLEDRRVEQREALVEVLATGREYVTSLQAVMLGASVPRDDVNFANSPGVDAHGPLDKAHRRSLLTARLLVRDPRILEHVTRLSLVLDKLPEQIKPLQDSARTRRGPADAETVGRAFAAPSAYGKGLDELERLTRERVVDDPREGPRRWRHRILLLLPRRRSRPDSQADGAAEAG